MVFSIPLPSWLTAGLHLFDVDWMRIGWLFPSPACLGTFSERLLMYALLPLALAALVAVCCLVGPAVAAAPSLRWRPGRRAEVGGSARGALRSGLLRALPFVLFVLFLFVPSVSSRIFASFACDHYGNGPLDSISFLHADPAVRCSHTAPPGHAHCNDQPMPE